MAGDHIRLGRTGEQAALSLLEQSGFRILETNWRCGLAELDIIAEDGPALCIVEVKTRRSTRKGLPREAVTPAKQKKIIQAALLYLKKTGRHDVPVRFDVVEVLDRRGTLTVNLIKHAFQAS